MRVGGGLLEMKMTTRVERTIKGKEDGEAESRERDWMKGCCGGRQTEGVTEKRRKRKIELTVSHMSGTLGGHTHMHNSVQLCRRIDPHRKAEHLEELSTDALQTGDAQEDP